MSTRWIICKDGEQHVAVEVSGKETKKSFFILERDNKPQWRFVFACIGHRTRFSKDDERLFLTREAAIVHTLQSIIAKHDELTKQLSDLDTEYMRLRSIV